MWVSYASGRLLKDAWLPFGIVHMTDISVLFLSHTGPEVIFDDLMFCLFCTNISSDWGGMCKLNDLGS